MLYECFIYIYLSFFPFFSFLCVLTYISVFIFSLFGYLLFPLNFYFCKYFLNIQIYFYNRHRQLVIPLAKILISAFAYFNVQLFFFFYFLHSSPRLITDFYIQSYFYFALHPYIFKFDAAVRSRNRFARRQRGMHVTAGFRSFATPRIFWSRSKLSRESVIIVVYAIILT